MIGRDRDGAHHHLASVGADPVSQQRDARRGSRARKTCSGCAMRWTSSTPTRTSGRRLAELVSEGYIREVPTDRSRGQDTWQTSQASGSNNPASAQHRQRAQGSDRMSLDGSPIDWN
jgi:hypothetical protein